jgi:hypothetical protein
MRQAIVNQLGSLLLANVELSVRVQELETENAALKKTQSEGKAKAEEHLAEQNDDSK